MLSLLPCDGQLSQLGRIRESQFFLNPEAIGMDGMFAQLHCLGDLWRGIALAQEAE